MAGAQSMMNDVRFLGGHGTAGPDGRRENPYNNAHLGDPDLNAAGTASTRACG